MLVSSGGRYFAEIYSPDDGSNANTSSNPVVFYETTLDLDGVSQLEMEYIYEVSSSSQNGLSVFVDGNEEFNTNSNDSVGSDNWKSQILGLQERSGVVGGT